MDRASDLRDDYDRLGRLLAEALPSEGASLARERRIIGELLESIERPEEVAFVDQVGDRRRAKAGAPRVTAGRRKSG